MVFEMDVFSASATAVPGFFSNHAAFTCCWPFAQQHGFTDFAHMFCIANLNIGHTVYDIDRLVRISLDMTVWMPLRGTAQLDFTAQIDEAV